MRTSIRKWKTVTGLLLPDSAATPAERLAGKQIVRRNQLLRLFRDAGRMSRIEASRHLSFNQRSVTLAVDELVSEGLLLEEKATVRGSGRPPVPVVFNTGAACVLGLDLGRSETVGMLMDLGGNLLAQLHRPSKFASDVRRQTEWLEEFMEELLEKCEGEVPPLAGAAFSAEGYVYSRHATQRFHEEAEGLCDRLRALLRVPVYWNFDSRLAALGERWFGSPEAQAPMVAVFNITEGLGFAPLIDGSPYEGARGWAGEIGHAPLGEAGVPCYCGSTGCLENIVSDAGLGRLAAAAGLKLRPKLSAMEQLIPMLPKSKPARTVMDKFSKGLAMAVTLVIDLYDPQAVVLSGRLARYADTYLPLFREELERRTVPFLLKDTRIIVSNLHEDAVTKGTCARVLHQIFDTSRVSIDQVV